MPRAALALARPRLLPGVLALPALGFGWAHWDRALPLRGAGALALVLLAWTALQTGTLWWNAALDRDEGDVLLGRPVPPPDGIGAAGLAAMLVAVQLGALASGSVGAATAVAALLAVAYSHPATAWKAHPWLGPTVNVVGYGLLSPFVGWAVVGVAPDARTLLVWAGGAVGVLGCFYVAQAFQEGEDRARGYRTRVATHGGPATVDAARLGLGAAWALLLALAAVGVLPRLLLLVAPWVVGLDRHLRAWASGPVTVDGAVDAGRRLARAVAVVLVLALVDHARAGLLGMPVAGLATVRGRPADVDLAPAWAVRRDTPAAGPR